MNKFSVLIIEDERKIREVLSRILEIEGYNVYKAENGSIGLDILTKISIDIVITDVKLPDYNGISLIQKIKELNSAIEVIVLTAYGNIGDAVKAIKSGAFDYLRKGEDDDKLIFVMERAFEKLNLQKQIKNLEDRMKINSGFEKIIGSSSSINTAIDLAKKVAPTDTTVLLLGETGTGKELFAEAIHNCGKRSSKQFIAINCAAVPAELQESEFFGHKKGSFTGANYDKKGVLEEADSGTLFLDEIGEMDIELQAKILRAIETGTFSKIGDINLIQTNIRIIAATNRNLSEEVNLGKFRKDLFYRLNMFTIEIPPLRARKDDIEVLLKYFIKAANEKLHKNIENYDNNFIEKLLSYSWPGNIRELKNIIERAIILAEKPFLSKDLLPDVILNNPVKNVDQPADSVYKPYELDSIENIEKEHILKILSRTDNNKIDAAKILKIGLTTLYRKLKDYGIE